MPTTPRSSERRRTGKRLLAATLCLCALGLLPGCVTAPERQASEFFLQPEASGENRAMQTRQFETHDEIELVSASAAVLQDLGFHIEESVRELGFLRGTKERTAREYGQEINRFLGGLLSGNQMPVDLQQKIAATLVAQPIASSESRYQVRIAFYRVVWKGDGSRSRGQGQAEYIPPGLQKMEMIRDATIYQQFFAKLSKAVFLEAHKI